LIIIGMKVNIQIHPLTLDRWKDLEILFGAKGACGGCWCMWWRAAPGDFRDARGSGNRAAFRRIVASGEAPGLIAYEGSKPVGWCALAPREEYPRLDRSRTMKRLDDQPVWSVTCFFVSREARGKGLTVRLLRAAVRYAKSRGASIVEGYPTVPGKNRSVDAFVFTGLLPAFLEAGFVVAKRTSTSRAIVRWVRG